MKLIRIEIMLRKMIDKRYYLFITVNIFIKLYKAIFSEICFGSEPPILYK